MSEKIRLNKYLATNFGVSRREADELIGQGKVTVNQQKARIGQSIDENDSVSLSRQEVHRVENKYIMLNKPIGYLCSRKSQGGVPTIYDLLPVELKKLKSVGRLDKDSSGLILLSNDGDFAFRMTHPKFAKIKIYEAELNRDLAPIHQQMLADFGVQLSDGRSQFGLTRLSENDRKHWEVSMSEGRNRQIRRSFEALGYKVVKLHRKIFGPYVLGKLASGKYTEVDKKIIQ